ncbi:peptidoglycan DD-metalloendopeptidase family protein [Leptospira sp. 2 VSF19]|uniref:Peptidoglycan DD-metalloendopeptidase family protein n=1 Tax=Leptospira soteropolitanensis TaxID=2950025 RepID=A0AAW5VI59_9LEPT|nr:M23 family metallopeptidase [Leptospira soteropolitanensis]MCW7492829.1 peptidoglycan DD-metalloendopeptidase family protein [Leptospira soteropolitanensis]MCW7500064.1 peptidoglycan DD-metalloendopeptidase family protein [Leptospira soteropolitanensis]MCW7522315.1 peptidoglycan DD-metalloendopeptidase family protein [Leptospira soteropolitanensis]MCW7526171.1 peptidoglycan DD-metalloendopeptidase family protein [Leptospira soteropolitanensis]MCW7529717.1 peptidoglycan DD-metalloendopeptida
MLLRSPEKSTIGKHVLRWGNVNVIQVSPGKYFYNLQSQSSVLHGTIDLNRKRYRILPLLTSSFILAFFLSVLVDKQTYEESLMEKEFLSMSTEVEENDVKDKEAKLADAKYLQETEDKKMAILRSADLDALAENKNKKLKVTQYKVKKNETLSDIARRFKVSAESIAGSSGINPEVSILPGQILNIPNKQGLVYKLKKGDTLAKVADYYKVKIDDIYAENQLEDYDLFKSGQKVFLPGAVIPETGPVWRIPVASKVITSGWGTRSYPQYKFHMALDLRANYESVYAARKGKVTYSGWMGGYGNAIILTHDDNYQTLYAHNSKLYVKEGDYVSAGKVISRSGCTGYCFGPHLHFEVIKDGKNVNPTKIMKGFSYK